MKVISGDDQVTVALSPGKLIENADRYVDATKISSQEEMERAVAECSVLAG
ncbi:MAG: hypothetical protein ACLSEX_11065 [Blautia sp.]